MFMGVGSIEQTAAEGPPPLGAMPAAPPLVPAVGIGDALPPLVLGGG
jgi:hypothetical protein